MQNPIRHFLAAILFIIVVTSCGFRVKPPSEGTVGGGGGGGPPPSTGGTTGGATGCSTNSVILAWETAVDTSGNPDQSVLGHVVYSGPSSRGYDRTYNQSVTAPVVTTYQFPLTGLGIGTYYLAVTAYNGAGESAYSNEIACSYTTCDTPCIVVAKGTSKNQGKVGPPQLELLSESELEKKNPKIYAEVKKQMAQSKESESFRRSLKVDLPPGDLTLNVEGYEKDWEKDEKQN